MLNSPKLGRPRKINTYENRAIIRASKADPLKIAVDIVTDFNKNRAITLNKISVSTVKRRLRCAGLFGRRPSKKKKNI